jgi:hypothetical protein
MSVHSQRALLAVCLGIAVGCGGGGNDMYPAPSPSTGVPDRVVSDADFREGGGSTDAGSDDGATGDGATGDGATDALGTTIAIAIVAPEAGAVVGVKARFAPQVDVTVTTVPGKPNDALQEVTANLTELATSKKVGSITMNQVGQQVLPESTVVTYHFADTPIDVAMLASGNYQLDVHAKTKGGVEADGSSQFLIDAGPTIRIDSPMANKPYKSSASVDVTISDDYFGPVSNVLMSVGQAPITFMGPGGGSGRQYTTTIDFKGFSPALEGEQVLTVRAKNKNGVESVAVRKFVSDNKGPTITNASPKDGELIGNVITISAQIEDPAAVLDSSVVAVFANGPGTEYTIALQPPAAGAMMPIYSALFDTRNLPFGENALFPTLSFRASDTLGNESLVTNVVWLDNKPPLSDIDPPDLRILAKNDIGGFRCSWPFDPVGPDTADDGDLVPQIVDIRARVEDQGNDVLSGAPNYIPVSGVNVAELLVLDDATQPLVVNTNPVAKGNLKADTTCDALNPLLVPTTKPMTSHDALVITLTSIMPTGSPDLTNDRPPPVNNGMILVGDDLSCTGGGGSKIPDSICDYSGNPAKAKYRLNRFDTVDTLGNPISFAQTQAHSDIMTVFLGYAGGVSSRLPSIWSLPPVGSGAANALCGGTQLDALANFLTDGWACFAIRAQDKLGNKQVSRPLRLCIDKDNDGKECPHKAIARVHDGAPITIETVAAHGFATGDMVKLSGIAWIGNLNLAWPIVVLDATHFTLTGSKAQPTLDMDPPPFGDWVRPVAGSQSTFIPGYAVRVSDIPNCTGTQTAEPPMPVVDGKTPCSPWRTYQPGEIRVYNGGG